MPERPDSDREVLTSLPRSRPARRSAKRDERPARDATRASAKPVAPRKPRTANAAPRAAAPPPQPATRSRTTAKAAPAAERPRVPPERKIPAAGYAAPDSRAGKASASPAAELISTSIQATAELAQIGLAVGRQTLQSMLDRLPKP
ncbi:MAG: hypothetical protein KY463_02010 [Actinobacteria bacterium]|nr:hypothetical protein [Actinomycetota bacterium]